MTLSMEGRIFSIRMMLEIQGIEGTWNKDEYNCGVYNGVEAALATLEGREPDFRQWEDPK